MRLSGEILVQKVPVLIWNESLLSNIVEVFVCPRWGRTVKQSARFGFSFQYKISWGRSNFQSIQASKADVHFPYFGILRETLKGISKFDKLPQNSLLKQLFFHGNTE